MISTGPSHPTSQHGPKIGLAASVTRQEEQHAGQVPPISKTPPPAAKSSGKAILSSNFGIAAGGGLVSLSQSALNQYMKDAKSLGATWIRWDINWSSVQNHGQNSWDWAATDRVASASSVSGLNSLVIISYTPPWARDPACPDEEDCQPADPQDFASFASAVASRYKAKNIHNYEIWNEPNFSWSPQADAAAYLGILKAAYPAIKNVDSGATVMTGGLAGTATENGDIAPVEFIQQIYTLGGASAFDAVALHPYSYPVLPSYQASWNFWQQMISVHQFMASRGNGAKKIWITEYGAPTGGPGSAKSTSQLDFTYLSDYMSETAQKDMAVDVVAQYRSIASWAGPLFWYSLVDDGTKADTSENFFGLLRHDHSPKPAYEALKNALAGL